MTFLEDESRHDAHLSLAHCEDAGAVGSDEAAVLDLEVLLHLHHVLCGNAFGDAYDDLDACFQKRSEKFSHKISLSSEQQGRFLYFVNKILTSNGYGHDLLEKAIFTELFVMINQIIVDKENNRAEEKTATYNEQVDAILSYLNNNIQYPISIGDLSKHFYISESYICRIFKSATGTTINKYMTARRISIAKSLLAEGIGVSEVCDRCGFSDYSNFLKAFTKSVGISPKKYSQYCNR